MMLFTLVASTNIMFRIFIIAILTIICKTGMSKRSPAESARTLHRIDPRATQDRPKINRISTQQRRLTEATSTKERHTMVLATLWYWNRPVMLLKRYFSGTARARHTTTLVRRWRWTRTALALH